MESRDWSSDVCSSDLFPSHDTANITQHIINTQKHLIHNKYKQQLNKFNHTTHYHTSHHTLPHITHTLPYITPHITIHHTPQPNNNTEPKPTPTASQTPAPSPIASIVHIEIKTPNGSSSFETEITDGMNLCDIMQKAKDSGKINSITFDDSYLSVYKSKYVQEINGFSNNWTFTVNGSTPLGCSLSNPKPNDSIIWKFG